MQISRLSLAVALAAASGVSLAAVPNVSPEVVAASEAIYKDPAVQSILAELSTPENAKERFNTHMELVRIASPSRQEFRRAAEIERRLLTQWGFSKDDIMTRRDGYLKGAGIQKIDGLPVYNVCVRIKGSYAGQKGAQSYKGQFPKVLIEGHTDTVNPAVLPPESNPYVPIRLQKITDKAISTPAQLAALRDELHFDKNGKIIEDANYKKAYVRYQNEAAAVKAGGYRIYVPGFGDAMGNTTSVMYIASMLKKHNVRPVYDLWICGTTGEEGKGNLAGMKQLYGYNQDTGKGNNALNFVANYGIDSTNIDTGTTANYLGSYRFEVKYTESAGAKPSDKGTPSALVAMSRSIAKISDATTPWDKDKSAEKTTYTVGVAKCDPAEAATGRSRSCTLMVDMRSLNQKPLSDIRAKIEPTFKAALDEENAKYGLKTGDKGAVSMTLVWFGDRPAYQRPDYNDPTFQSYWQSARSVGIDIQPAVYEDPASVNDNVPAAVGVPTVNFNVHTPAVHKGSHAFWKWGIPGDAQGEAKRMVRAIVAALTSAGFHTSDGKVIKPNVGPVGARTTEDLYE